MTLTNSFIRTAQTTPRDARIMNMAGVTTNADGSPRPGVLSVAAPTLLTPQATMHVSVGIAEFATTRGRADGVAIFGNDGAVQVPITAAPIANSRIDVIWVKHNDTESGDANSLPVFGVTDGVAAGSPVKSAIPTGALELGTIRVYAGTTAANGGTNVTQNTYQMTAARGGVVPFRNKAEMDLWTTAVPGQAAITLDTGEQWARTATGWALTFRPLLAWTPALSGITLGNGTLRCHYAKRDKVIEFFIEILAGSTTVMTGNLVITLPEAIADVSMHRHLGNGYLTYTGATVGNWPIEPRATGASSVTAALLDTGGAYGTPAIISDSLPTSAAWNLANLRPSVYLHGTYRTAA